MKGNTSRTYNIIMSVSDENNIMMQVIRLLLESGLPNMNLLIACGIAGVMDVLTGFNYTVYSNNNTSYGLCQWYGKHLTSLMGFCKDNNLGYGSVEGQVKYLINDLKTQYAQLYSLLSSDEVRNDIEKTASNFCTLYDVFLKNRDDICQKSVESAKQTLNRYQTSL